MKLLFSIAQIKQPTVKAPAQIRRQSRDCQDSKIQFRPARWLGGGGGVLVMVLAMWGGGVLQKKGESSTPGESG